MDQELILYDRYSCCSFYSSCCGHAVNASTAETFVAVMDPGTYISFRFARCRCLYTAAADAAALGSMLMKDLLINQDLTWKSDTIRLWIILSPICNYDRLWNEKVLRNWKSDNNPKNNNNKNNVRNWGPVPAAKKPPSFKIGAGWNWTRLIVQVNYTHRLTGSYFWCTPYLQDIRIHHAQLVGQQSVQDVYIHYIACRMSTVNAAIADRL